MALILTKMKETAEDDLGGRSVSRSSPHQPMISVKDKSEDKVMALILTKMKETAEDDLGREVSLAVITAPACLNDARRQSTKGASEIPGMNALRFTNEPTAAAVAYGPTKGRRRTFWSTV